MDVTRTLETLKRHGFAVGYYPTAQEAANAVAASVSGKTVGIGGSVTVEQLGLYELLQKDNNVFWHWKQPGAETRVRASEAQVYICSLNAIAETGELINIDGTGNRVAATLCGRERVIFIAGVNKIEPDFERAMQRARNVAAPLNAKRLGRKTPCALSAEMRCYDCGSPERICGGVVTLLRPMHGVGSTEVVLVGESLGY